MATFADRLKQLRKEMGLTQTELAQRLGVACGTIGNYEAGLREPKKFDDLNSMADFFNVEIDYLLGRSDERPEFNLEEQWIISCYREADPDTQAGIKAILRRFDKQGLRETSAS